MWFPQDELLPVKIFLLYYLLLLINKYKFLLHLCLFRLDYCLGPLSNQNKAKNKQTNPQMYTWPTEAHRH